jgi:hypothetical protein
MVSVSTGEGVGRAAAEEEVDRDAPTEVEREPVEPPAAPEANDTDETDSNGEESADARE